MWVHIWNSVFERGFLGVYFVEIQMHSMGISAHILWNINCVPSENVLFLCMGMLCFQYCFLALCMDMKFWISIYNFQENIMSFIKHTNTCFENIHVIIDIIVLLLSFQTSSICWLFMRIKWQQNSKTNICIF